MLNFVPLTPQGFRSKALRPVEGYGFARNVSTVAISASEFPSAAHSMPIGFSVNNGRYAAVAIMGLTPGQNLFVAPDGRWLGTYIPALLRTYPLRLMEGRDAPEERVLCIDDSCPSIVETGQGNGEPLFDLAGRLGPQILKLVELMKQLERERLGTENAIAKLANVGVLRPWDVKIGPESPDISLEGLVRVDESLLSQVDDTAFSTLRKSLAVPLAYAHLLSMYHLTTLNRLHAMQAQLASQQLAPLATLDGAFKITGENSLRFD